MLISLNRLKWKSLRAEIWILFVYLLLSFCFLFIPICSNGFQETIVLLEYRMNQYKKYQLGNWFLSHRLLWVSQETMLYLLLFVMLYCIWIVKIHVLKTICCLWFLCFWQSKGWAAASFCYSTGWLAGTRVILLAVSKRLTRQLRDCISIRPGGISNHLHTLDFERIILLDNCYSQREEAQE